MKCYKLRDGERLTTPLYVGAAHAVTRMRSCDHQFQTAAQPPEEPLPGVRLYLQLCEKCGASRARLEGEEAALMAACGEVTEQDCRSSAEECDPGENEQKGE